MVIAPSMANTAASSRLADLQCVLLASKDAVSFLAVNGVPLFFAGIDNQYVPILKLVHKCRRQINIQCQLTTKCMMLSSLVCSDPFILPTVQIDKGGIPFILKGADVMCPGVTSPGGKLPDNLEAGAIVVLEL